MFKPFSPIEVSPLVWLDASNASSLTLSGSNVTQWNDLSGHGNNATAFAGNAVSGSTINSLNALNFNGAAELIFNCNVSTAIVEVFVACQPAAGSANEVLIAIGASGVATGSAASSASLIQMSTSSGTTGPWNIFSYRNGTAYAGTTNVYTAGTTYVFGCRYTGTDNLMHNAGADVTDTASVTGSFASVYGYLGGSATTGGASHPLWYGNIGEVLVFTTALTTAQRNIIDGYLTWKWGIASQLATSHPYRYSAPNCGLARPPIHGAIGFKRSISLH